MHWSFCVILQSDIRDLQKLDIRKSSSQSIIHTISYFYRCHNFMSKFLFFFFNHDWHPVPWSRFDWFQLTYFRPMLFFQSPLKTSKNFWYSDVSRRYRKDTLAWNKLITSNITLRLKGWRYSEILLCFQKFFLCNSFHEITVASNWFGALFSPKQTNLLWKLYLISYLMKILLKYSAEKLILIFNTMWKTATINPFHHVYFRKLY